MDNIPNYRTTFGIICVLYHNYAQNAMLRSIVYSTLTIRCTNKLLAIVRTVDTMQHH